MLYVWLCLDKFVCVHMATHLFHCPFTDETISNEVLFAAAVSNTWTDHVAFGPEVAASISLQAHTHKNTNVQ